MSGIVLLNASRQSWDMAREQTPAVIGLPALPRPVSVGTAKICGLFPGGTFIAICRHFTLFRARIIADPFIDETPLFAGDIYPLRVPFEVEQELGARWYTGRDTRDVLEMRFVGTIYRLNEPMMSLATVRMDAFSCSPANAQRLLF